jgi:hypothetical protein
MHAEAPQYAPRTFDKAVEVTGDFEAVFKADIYDYIVLPRDSESLIDMIDGINAFIEDIDYYRLEEFEADIVGHVYEELRDKGVDCYLFMCHESGNKLPKKC